MSETLGGLISEVARPGAGVRAKNKFDRVACWNIQCLLAPLRSPLGGGGTAALVLRSIGMPDKPTHVNIASTSDDWRGRALSNFSLSPFVFEGELFASIEGFIQGIKFAESDPRRLQAFHLDGWDAKRIGEQAERRCVYWAGRCLTYGSQPHQQLVEAAIRARIAQSTGLQQALLSTGDTVIIHDTGQPESATTSLPGAVFCRIMTDIRDELRRAP